MVSIVRILEKIDRVITAPHCILSVSFTQASCIQAARSERLYTLEWRHKSPVSPLFTEPFIQAQIKENIKC